MTAHEIYENIYYSILPFLNDLFETDKSTSKINTFDEYIVVKIAVRSNSSDKQKSNGAR